MAKKKLMKGAEAIGEAAIHAGCRAYFAYPITPQTEVAEYLAKRMPDVGGIFLQAESEIGASNMLFGAAGSGVRAFTTSSSPGISLMSEAMSFLTTAELPVVFVNIVRSGPGLGGILPAQSDYFQATKGGGHGDYHLIVLAPSSIQEAVDMMIDAFDLADRYRNPVMLMGDGLIGQMMEPVALPDDYTPVKTDKSAWATTGCKGRDPKVVKTLFLDADECGQHNIELKNKYDEIAAKETRFEAYATDDDYDVLLVSYGTMSRVCKSVIDDLRAEGVKVGLIRPKTLFPFPMDAIRRAADKPSVKAVLSVEMSMGQMVEDVERAVRGLKPVQWFGRAGGIIPSAGEIAEKIRQVRG